MNREYKSSSHDMTNDSIVAGTTWKCSGMAVQLNTKCSLLGVNIRNPKYVHSDRLASVRFYAILRLSLAVRLFISDISLATCKADAAVRKAMSQRS